MVEFRARFDTNKNVQDLMKAKRLLVSGEEELKKAMYWHTENFNCKSYFERRRAITPLFAVPESPNGIAEHRYPTPEDAVCTCR